MSLYPSRLMTAWCVSGPSGAAPHIKVVRLDRSCLSTSGCLASKTARGGTKCRKVTCNQTKIYNYGSFISILLQRAQFSIRLQPKSVACPTGSHPFKTGSKKLAFNLNLNYGAAGCLIFKIWEFQNVIISESIQCKCKFYQDLLVVPGKGQAM